MFGYVTNDSNPRYAGFYNYGDEDVTGYPGVRIENTAGGDAVYAYYAEEVTLDKPLDTGSVALYNNIPIDMSTVTLAPGQTYRAYPIFRQNNKDYDVSVDPDSRAYAEFTTAGEPSKNYNISVTDFEYDPIKAGEDFAMKFTVTNSGTDPFSGEIHLQLTELIDATLEAVPAYDVTIDMENNTVEPGESVTLSGTVKTLFEENSLYTAEFECDGERVSDTYLVLVGNKITNIELPEAVSLTVGDDPDFLEVVYTPEDATWKRVEWTSSDITVAAVSENGGIEAINKGTAEITATTTDGSELSATCLVTVEDGSIVGIVMLEGVCDVYTVDGVAVATGMEMKEIVNLPAGIYMIRTADKTFKYYKKR